MLGWLNPEPEVDDARSRPARRPHYALALLVAGYFLARHEPGLPSAGLFAGAAAAALLGLLTCGWACRVALGAAMMLGGAGWFAARINERPADSLYWSLERDPLAEPPVVRVGGLVVTPVRELDAPRRAGGFKPTPARACAMDLSLRWVETEAGRRTVSGRVRVHVEAPSAMVPDEIRPGTVISPTGVLRRAPAPMNPGEPPRDLLASQEGRIGTLVVPDVQLLALGEPARGLDRLAGAWARMREAARSRVAATLGPAPGAAGGGAEGRALLRAMLLGERDPALSEVESAFRRVGLVHLVAISGFNLAVLVWVTLLAIRVTGDQGRLEAVLGSVAVLAYLLVLPGEASIQRSGLTLLAFTAAEACGRRYDRLTLLACAAMVLLVVRPMDLWSLGFQLSFGIVGALLWLGARVHARLWGLPIRGLTRTPRQRTWWWVAGSWVLGVVKAQITATLLAWAVAAPLIALHTGLFSPLAPLASLVVLPLTVLLLTAGYAVMLLGLIAPPAAEMAGGALSLLGQWTVWMVRWIDEWPGATVHLPRLSPLWALGATACVVGWLGWCSWRDARAWIATAAIAAWLALLLTAGVRLPTGVALRVDALACGDGQCQLLRSGGAAMLVNAGATGARPNADDLARAVRALGAWRVPTLLITEPDVQAWSEAADLVAPLGIRTVLIPASIESAARLEPNGAASQLLRALGGHGVVLRVVGPQDRFTLSEDASVEILGRAGAASRELVARARVQTRAGPRAIVFAGSGRSTQLEALPPTDRHADVLIAPSTLRGADRPAEAARALGAAVVIHPGSATQAREFLRRFGPRDAPVLTTAAGAAWAKIGADGAVHWGRPPP